MSKRTHTRGPWTVLPEEAGRNYIRVRGTQLGETYKVANVVTPSWEGFPDAELEEARANARLIASSPTLLEACTVARDLIRSLGDMDRWTIDGKDTGHSCPLSDLLDAAIALAEGGDK